MSIFSTMPPFFGAVLTLLAVLLVHALVSLPISAFGVISFTRVWRKNSMRPALPFIFFSCVVEVLFAYISLSFSADPWAIIAYGVDWGLHVLSIPLHWLGYNELMNDLALYSSYVLSFIYSSTFMNILLWLAIPLLVWLGWFYLRSTPKPDDNSRYDGAFWTLILCMIMLLVHVVSPYNLATTLAAYHYLHIANTSGLWVFAVCTAAALGTILSWQVLIIHPALKVRERQDQGLKPMRIIMRISGTAVLLLAGFLLLKQLGLFV